jgi:hypothetical protein
MLIPSGFGTASERKDEARVRARRAAISETTPLSAGRRPEA